MGQFFTSKIWLETREIEMLNNYDFTEEVYESDIPNDEIWTLKGLCQKGFLHLYPSDKGNIYQSAGGYLQHFNN